MRGGQEGGRVERRGSYSIFRQELQLGRGTIHRAEIVIGVGQVQVVRARSETMVGAWKAVLVAAAAMLAIANAQGTLVASSSKRGLLFF